MSSEGDPSTIDLRDVWERSVNRTFLYRIVSDEYVPSILSHGLNPERDPFEKRKPQLEELFSIVLRLKAEGFLMYHWWGRPVDQERIVSTTRTDLANPFIDFTPDYTERIAFYLALRGGALVTTVRLFTDELLEKGVPLSSDELALVRTLNRWSRARTAYENCVLHVRASSPIFENAHLQHLEATYITSPFGGFEHFEKTIRTKGLAYYRPVLERTVGFYLRVRDAIPATEIAKVTKRAPNQRSA